MDADFDASACVDEAGQQCYESFDSFVEFTAQVEEFGQRDLAVCVEEVVAFSDRDRYGGFEVLATCADVTVREVEGAQDPPCSRLAEPVAAGLCLGERLLEQTECLCFVADLVVGDERGCVGRLGSSLRGSRPAVEQSNDSRHPFFVVAVAAPQVPQPGRKPQPGVGAVSIT